MVSIDQLIKHRDKHINCWVKNPCFGNANMHTAAVASCTCVALYCTLGSCSSPLVLVRVFRGKFLTCNPFSNTSAGPLDNGVSWLFASFPIIACTMVLSCATKAARFSDSSKSQVASDRFDRGGKGGHRSDKTSSSLRELRFSKIYPLRTCKLRFFF